MSSTPVTLVGNLTADPKLTFTSGGTPKLEFSLACNHNWRDADGEWQKKTSYIDCVAWRNTADDGARVLEKGVGAVITGRLEQREWDDKETGKKRTKIEVVVDEVAILVRSIEEFTRRRGNGDGAQQQAAPARKAPAASNRPAPADDPF